MNHSRLTLQDAGDAWVLPVDGQQVTRCCVDYAAVSLLLANGLEVYIECPFAYSVPGGVDHNLDPEDEASSLAPILRLRRLHATGAEASKRGSLEIHFEDGSLIRVPAHQAYEPWNISGPGGPDGLKLVSMPGGELAIWSDRR